MAIAISSLIASFASMPFALYHFGITTSWSVAANMIGMPLMGLIIMPMGVAAMVLSVFGAEAVPLYVMNVGIISLSYAAEYISSLDGARLAVFPPSGTVTVLLAVAMIILGIASGLWRAVSVIVLMVAFGLWWSNPRPVAGMVVNYGKPVLAVMSRDGYLLTSTTKTKGFTAQILSQPFGRSELIYVRDYLKNAEHANLNNKADVFCYKDSCYITTANDQIFAMVWARADLTIACQTADVVLALVNASYPCRDGSPLFDRNDLIRQGGVLIYSKPEKVQFDESEDQKTDIIIRSVNIAG
jgi:competence protein ComEC